jgi:hypothetical protein
LVEAEVEYIEDLKAIEVEAQSIKKKLGKDASDGS